MGSPISIHVLLTILAYNFLKEQESWQNMKLLTHTKKESSILSVQVCFLNLYYVPNKPFKRKFCGIGALVWQGLRKRSPNKRNSQPSHLSAHKINGTPFQKSALTILMLHALHQPFPIISPFRVLITMYNYLLYFSICFFVVIFYFLFCVGVWVFCLFVCFWLALTLQCKM